MDQRHAWGQHIPDHRSGSHGFRRRGSWRPYDELLLVLPDVPICDGGCISRHFRGRIAIVSVGAGAEGVGRRLPKPGEVQRVSGGTGDGGWRLLLGVPDMDARRSFSQVVGLFLRWCVGPIGVLDQRIHDVYHHVQHGMFSCVRVCEVWRAYCDIVAYSCLVGTTRSGCLSPTASSASSMASWW